MPNEKGTSVYTLQKKFQNMFGFTLPLFHGRGLLNYNLGLLPYRRRIVAVSEYLPSVVQPLLTSRSRPPYPRREVREAHLRGDHARAATVHRRAYEVRIRWLSVANHLTLVASFARIWHTHKDEFARTRKRELSIIE